MTQTDDSDQYQQLVNEITSQTSVFDAAARKVQAIILDSLKWKLFPSSLSKLTVF